MPKTLDELRRELRQGIDAREPKDLRHDSERTFYDEEAVVADGGLVDDPLADMEDAETEPTEWGTPRWVGSLPEVIKTIKGKSGTIKGKHADLIIMDDIIDDGDKFVGKASVPGAKGEFEIHISEKEMKELRDGKHKGISISGKAAIAGTCEWCGGAGDLVTASGGLACEACVSEFRKPGARRRLDETSWPKKPKRKKKDKGIDLGKFKASRTTAGGSAKRFHSSRYSISEDGCDAILNFGKHSGTSVSQLARTSPGYLRWMQSEDFPPDLMDIISFVLDGPMTTDRRMKHRK